jgi:hypothetical protein
MTGKENGKREPTEISMEVWRQIGPLYRMMGGIPTEKIQGEELGKTQKLTANVTEEGYLAAQKKKEEDAAAAKKK